MISKLKELAKAHKIKVGLVSGAIVVSSVLGTCSFTPSPSEIPAPAGSDASVGGSDAGEPDAGSAE